MPEFIHKHERLVRKTLAFGAAVALGIGTVACDDSKPDGNNVAPSSTHTQSAECPQTRLGQLGPEVGRRNGHPVFEVVLGKAGCKELLISDSMRGLPDPKNSLTLGDRYEVLCKADEGPSRMIVFPLNETSTTGTVLLDDLPDIYLSLYPGVPTCQAHTTPTPSPIR